MSLSETNLYEKSPIIKPVLRLVKVTKREKDLKSPLKRGTRL